MTKKQTLFSVTKFYFFLSFLGLSFSAFSQVSPVYDYIKNIDSLKINLEEYKSSGNDSLMIAGLLEISKNYYMLGDYDNAIENASGAKEIAHQHSPLGEANACIYLGNFHAEKKEYSKALASYKDAVLLFEKLEDFERKSVALTNIAVLFEWTDNDSLSLKYHQEALSIKKTLQDSVLLAQSYINIANTYASLENDDQAFEHYKRALVIYQQEKDQEGISLVYNNFGYMYQKQGNLQAALDAFYASYIIDKKQNNLGALEVSSFNIGHLYYDLNQLDSARHYLDYSQSISKQIYGLTYLLKSSKLLVDIALKEKDIPLAEKVFSDYAEYSNSLYNEEKLQNFLNAKNDLIIQKQEFENQILTEKEQASKTILFWVASAGFLLLLLLIITLISIRNIKKSRRTLGELNKDLYDKNEEIEIQKEFLESISQEKDNLMSILAHDLRSPLSGIKGLNQVMRDEGNFTEFQQELAQTIDLAVDSGLKLINDILIIKKMEELDEELIMNEIDPKFFTNTIFESFQPLLLKKNQKLELNLISEEKLITNKEYLGSVIENLVSNAIKYSDLNKKIILSYYTTDTSFCFEIRDEGPGIHPDEVPLLFKKFQKLSARPTANEFSSGLGLFIVKSFADKLNGEIKVSSELGKGSTFTVKLPKVAVE